jgi:ubiquinone biosynthesis protein COQ9
LPQEIVMIDQSTPKGRVIAAAMRLAAEKPWADVAMLDIAEAAGVSLLEIKKEFPSKAAILMGFSRAIDAVVLTAVTKRQPGTPPRDALFEVLMSRFDAMQPYRAGLRSIVGAGLPDMALMQRLFSSQAWMLNAAGVPLNGVGGTVRVFGLTSVYASVLRTWLDDDDAGQARTMAALDRRLRRGEGSLATFDSVCGSVTGVFEMLMGRRPTKPAAPASDATQGDKAA